jgi:hypothetical protein
MNEHVKNIVKSIETINDCQYELEEARRNHNYRDADIWHSKKASAEGDLETALISIIDERIKTINETKV